MTSDLPARGLPTCCVTCCELTGVQRGCQHLVQDVLLNDKRFNFICLLTSLRLITLVDGTENQCLAVCGLDPKDDAPEEVPLWGAL